MRLHLLSRRPSFPWRRFLRTNWPSGMAVIVASQTMKPPVEFTTKALGLNSDGENWNPSPVRI
jgi:hypothetical protein